MNNLTTLLGDIYLPEKALLIYRSNSGGNYYVESFDMDENGCPINAHPLTVKEGNALALALESTSEAKQNFLISRGIIPEHILHINSNREGYAIWCTPAMTTKLLFNTDLDITDGEANVPPLLWKASKSKLQIWALPNDKRPDADTCLYHAPFFNISDNGSVCMGSVAVAIHPQWFLEDFMQQWQSYFFDSKFSHMIMQTSPTKTNIVQLWQKLIGTNKPFPLRSLKKTNQTLKSLLK